ncbi:helix-turn-helix transcriptional regulator [Salicibibacter cibarius]|uniref:Helix-turn-helix transcriptional regulator n=1 Tax=Salicibibacter cibarius TaxID=2743000 RepID=A0A7T6Z0R0_9BACI|nr:helix-turn-helix transcriptional regulator [Salicibibacter cibarius]QQK74865.1 helix-turn-helix transcriptional regulator [Salicibibacter cibarius]
MVGHSLEIDKTILYIQQNLHEPLTLSELAGHVAYSPYHFTRMFKERMGISPLYYVSSLRLQKAKDLLLHTDLGIRDIGLEIGQQSFGTFTTRFTERVGVSPSRFRTTAQQADVHLGALQKLDKWTPLQSGMDDHNKIAGAVQAEFPFEGIILIGLFAKPIPEGFPLYGTLLSSLGEFCFTDVQPGIYYLMATAVSWDMQGMDFLMPHTTLRGRAKEAIMVSPSSPVPYQKLLLHPPRLDDPPILISLPLLMQNFLNRIHQHSNR